MPPQSLSILLCVVATFGVALEELNWEPCIPEDTRYHEYSFLKITFMSCLQMTKIRHLKSPQGNSVAFQAALVPPIISLWTACNSILF